MALIAIDGSGIVVGRFGSNDPAYAQELAENNPHFAGVFLSKLGNDAVGKIYDAATDTAQEAEGPAAGV